MPKKRTSTKSRKDEPKKEDDSVSIFQEDDDAKRSKLEPLKDTTLQHLPIELLESILIKAVAMEVLELRVANCARKEQADLVIRRLRTVCSQWNCVLTTDIFRKKVHRLLEDTIRFEILDQPSFQENVYRLTTLKDEIFLLCSTCRYYPFPTVIHVYDRNNMAEVKDVIPLVQKMWPIDMASCSVSNCVYTLSMHGYYCPSVFCIKKDEEHHFKVSPWLSNRGLSFTSRGPMSVASNGNLVILSGQESPSSALYAGLQVVSRSAVFMAKVACVSIFNANGSLQHTIKLSPDIYGFKIINSVLQKSDGNLVLLAANDENNAKLLEIDTSGRILRQYQSSFNAVNIVMSFAEVYGKILVVDHRNRIQLFDTDFNLVEIADPPPPEGYLHNIGPQIHFNSERNEIVRLEQLTYVYYGARVAFKGSVLSIFRCTDE